MMPLLALGILAVAAAGALVLDRLWIDAAQVQLTAAAEAAALAAAARLADDDRLRQPYDATLSIQEAKAAADAIARKNFVAGQPVQLNLSAQGDVRFGKIVDDPTTGDSLFLETQVNPTTVDVVAQSLRRRGNPLVLFFRGVTGQPTGNARGHAEATIENRIIGLRPLPGTTVPCLPIGLLEIDPTGTQQNTWTCQIDNRNGQDHFGYDPAGNKLVESPDGIPELTLTAGVNLHTLDLGTGLSGPLVQKQIANGLTESEMNTFGGELILEHDPLAVAASASLVGDCKADLEQQIGKTVIALLYQDQSPGSDLQVGRKFATRLVALRILKIAQTEGEPLQMTVQPSVIATRAAVLSDDAGAYRNPYVYKLYLTQ